MLGKSVALSKSLLPNIRGNVVSIHCEFTVANIVYKIDTSCPLNYIAVQKDELKPLLQEIHCQLNADTTTKVFVTGSNKVWTKKIAESVFHTDVTIVDDILATSKGLELISNHLNFSDIEYKYEGAQSFESKYGKIDESPMINQIRKALQAKEMDTTEIDETKFNFPAILIMANSFLNYYLVKKDKSIVPIHTTVLGTETLTGLAKCITDLNTYDDIATMAKNGNRENVDNQVFEVFPDDAESPYGKLPPKLPLFPFGKCNLLDKGAESFHKDDLLASLCSMIYNSVTSIGLTLCRIYKIRTAYMLGGLFNCDFFAELASSHSNLLQTSTKLQILRSQYMLALGAMN